MKSLKIAAFGAVVLLSGCAQPEWRRLDGRPADESFNWAVRECRNRASDRDEPVRAMRHCMYRHGYVWSEGSGGGGRY
jgi:hypothetical protein